ncbi:prepilin-type N-terminal cleavage/methylation domain-containing protein [Aurantivibrio plasticivorans]
MFSAWRTAKGFTLLELVTIIVILGVLTFFTLPRLNISDSSLLAGRDTVVAAANHAQQVAMARASVSNPITLVVNTASIDVQESGNSVVIPGVEYPISFENGVSVTAGTGVLAFDKLGRTTPTTISLNNGGASVAVEASGYAH